MHAARGPCPFASKASAAATHFAASLRVGDRMARIGALDYQSIVHQIGLHRHFKKMCRQSHRTDLFPFLVVHLDFHHIVF